MNIRVYAPNPIQNQLQEMVNDCVNNLRTFFTRIKTVEVFMTDEKEKTVEIKLYLMRRVLHTIHRSDAFETALINATEKMQQQLITYRKEVAIF